MRISVVIPTWNEAVRLPRTVAAVRQSPKPHEIIVVDANSDDGTAGVAARLACKLLPAAPRLRASQLNLGAANSTGDILLFLHADTILPHNALTTISAALAGPGVVGGCFSRRFDSASGFLRVTCHLADLRARFGWILGDQAMFVRRDVFDRLGGFKDYPLFEDLEFSRRLHRLGSTVCLQPPVRTSARRFDRLGPVRTTAIDVWLTVRYLTGASPEQLIQSADRLLKDRASLSSASLSK